MTSNEFEEENKKEIGKSLKHFTVLQLLSKGDSVFVAKVKSKKNNQIYAMKCYDYSKDKKRERESYLNEKIFLKNFNHENICKYYLHFEEKEAIYIIMEYMDNGSLSNLLTSYMKMKKN